MIIRDVYYSRPINDIVTFLSLDYTFRKFYHLYRCVNDDIRTIEINEAHADFLEHTLLEGGDLKVELEVLNDLLDEISPDQVFFDIGADAGLYSCLVGEVVDNDSEIVAFEPHPSRRIQLKDNLQRNGTFARVRTEALANTEATGYIDYGIKTKDGKIIENENNSSIEIDLFKGDTLVQQGQIPVPNIIKIDVEGAELEVIRGLEKTLSSKEVRVVYVEVHQKIHDFGGTSQDLEKFLTQLGFQTHSLKQRGSEEFIKASRDSS